MECAEYMYTVSSVHAANKRVPVESRDMWTCPLGRFKCEGASDVMAGVGFCFPMLIPLYLRSHILMTESAAPTEAS